jgi:hypothetical protein
MPKFRVLLSNIDEVVVEIVLTSTVFAMGLNIFSKLQFNISIVISSCVPVWPWQVLDRLWQYKIVVRLNKRQISHL